MFIYYYNITIEFRVRSEISVSARCGCSKKDLIKGYNHQSSPWIDVFTKDENPELAFLRTYLDSYHLVQN